MIEGFFLRLDYNTACNHNTDYDYTFFGVISLCDYTKKLSNQLLSTFY